MVKETLSALTTTGVIGPGAGACSASGSALGAAGAGVGAGAAEAVATGTGGGATVGGALWAQEAQAMAPNTHITRDTKAFLGVNILGLPGLGDNKDYIPPSAVP